jgi:hypothetical protein
MTSRVTIALAFFLLLVSPSVRSQTYSSSDSSHASHSARAFAEKRLHEQQRGMWILGAWAGLSIVAGTALAIQKSNEPLRYQAFQHVGWGTVNAAIAGFALYGISSQLAAAGDATLLSELIEENKFSKILLVNVGLDVGYMAVGSVLMYGSRNGLKSSDKFFGSGAGVLIQGAFLFIYDILQIFWSSERLALVELQIKPLIGVMPQTYGLTLGISF